MADNRPREFTSYSEAYKDALRIANIRCGARYVGLLRPGLWVVGIFAQLSTQLGLEPLVRVCSNRGIRRKQDEIEQIYQYWNHTGNIDATAKRFECSKSNVYRIISMKRTHK